MSQKQLKEIQELKNKFKELSPKKRENVSVCFLKAKLGVNTAEDLRHVKDFLGSYKMELTPENLDHMITFLHSENHTLPEFIALEDSLNSIEIEKNMGKDFGLPNYDPDDVETLTEAVKPFKPQN